MDLPIKISPDDIELESEDPLDLFYAGIKAKQTRDTLNRTLKKFLLEACEEILSGDYKERAKQFVELARTDQRRAVSIIIAYVKQLKKRTMLERTHPNYMNPSYVPNKIKPIKKLFTMNDVGLPWKRIRMYYPEIDNTHKGRGYTREEIRILLEHSNSIETDFIILASSSGGLRIGAWEDQRWGNIFPVYKVDEQYKLELEDGEKGQVVCAGMIIYKGTREEYVALFSIEAWEKLQEYKKKWTIKFGRPPKNDDPLILARYHKPTQLCALSIKEKIEKLVRRAGLRTSLPEGRRRYDVPVTHGFRRYWDKIMMQTKHSSGTLSSLVIKERLFGHYGLVKTDKNYFWTDTVELVPEYLEAMPELMITEEYRLQKKLEQQIKRNDELEQTLQEKKIEMRRVAELETKIERMQHYNITPQ